jgi:hypothetical protein
MENEENDYFEDSFPDFGIIGQYRPSGYEYNVYYKSGELIGIRSCNSHHTALEFCKSIVNVEGDFAKLRTVQVLIHDSLPTEHLVISVEEFGERPTD